MRPIQKTVEKPKAEQKESIGDFEEGIRNGKYLPVPDPQYIYVQKHYSLKIVNTRRGVNREYELWPLRKEVLNADKKAGKKDSVEMPDKCKFYIEYREDGQVHVFLRKSDLGRTWTAAEKVVKPKE